MVNFMTLTCCLLLLLLLTAVIRYSCSRTLCLEVSSPSVPSSWCRRVRAPMHRPSKPSTAGVHSTTLACPLASWPVCRTFSCWVGATRGGVPLGLTVAVQDLRACCYGGPREEPRTNDIAMTGRTSSSVWPPPDQVVKRDDEEAAVVALPSLEKPKPATLASSKGSLGSTSRSASASRGSLRNSPSKEQVSSTGGSGSNAPPPKPPRASVWPPPE